MCFNSPLACRNGLKKMVIRRNNPDYLSNVARILNRLRQNLEVMKKKDSVKAIIISSDFEEIVTFWNIYSEKCTQGDDNIYPNEDEEIDEQFPNASEFARASKYGHYDYEDKYFCKNHYGNLVSFNDIDDRFCPINLSRLADYLILNGDSEFPIDDDWLVKDFLLEYFPNPEDDAKAREIIDRLNESEPMDFLMQEWDDLYKDIKVHWND